MIELLKKLCAINSVSGYEDAMRDFIRSHAQPYADEIREDPAGNLMILRRGRSSDRRIMLCAHMDEVGLLVTQIDKTGQLKYSPIGRVPAATLAGKRVRVGDNAVAGIIGIKAIHLTSRKERGLVPARDTIRIDIGARSRAEAEKLTFRGDVVSFDSEIRDFGAHRLMAKALDSRIGCAVLLHLLPHTPAYDTWYIFSVQHQIGSGIQSAVHRIAPDLAVVLDCTDADDIPGGKNTCRLGAGLVLADTADTMRFDPATLETLRTLAADAKLPVQSTVRTLPSAGETARIASTGYGVPTAAIHIPARYLRTAHIVADLRDVDAMEKLCARFIVLE